MTVLSRVNRIDDVLATVAMATIGVVRLLANGRSLHLERP
jgi:hypothetical protein